MDYNCLRPAYTTLVAPSYSTVRPPKDPATSATDLGNSPFIQIHFGG